MILKQHRDHFSNDRDGFVIGEGAVVLILEELEHALKRNAPIYAEIVGGGASCDATHIVAPDEFGEGAARAIAEALRDAEIDPTAVDYINAHGTSTALNDERETLAIKKVFKEHAYKVAVSSTKSMVGHLLGGAGALGAAATALTLFDHKIHPTINYGTPDPKCDLRLCSECLQRSQRKTRYLRSAWIWRTQHCPGHEGLRLVH